MSTRDDVLEALRASSGLPLSGEEIALSLGVSRVAVGKHVKALREAGYGIEAAAGSGYRLTEVPDAPVPAEVRALLNSALWVRLEGGGETASTNDDARALARAGAPEGTVVLASRQTGGRGRLGRSWHSPVGGAYVSAVLRPRVAPSEVSSLALAVALGVARGVKRLGVDARVKWPNDVLVDDRKVAGVLLEMAAEPDCVNWVVAGVGLNVHAPVDAPPTAGWLTDSVPSIRVPQATAAVLDGIADTYVQWCREGFAGLRSEYSERATLTGRRAAVRDAFGAVLGDGVVVGVDESGRLLLDTGHGVEGFSAGEVTLRA